MTAASTTAVVRRERASIGRILRLARPEWRGLALGTFFLAISSAAGLVYPRGIQYLLDGALGDPSGASIDQAAIFMVVVLAIQAVTTSLRSPSTHERSRHPCSTGSNAPSRRGSGAAPSPDDHPRGTRPPVASSWSGATTRNPARTRPSGSPAHVARSR